MFLQINIVLIRFGLFAYNQKVIAETLCEGKVMDCSGHCFLLKKINTANDIESAPTGKKASTKTLEELLNAMSAALPKLQLALHRLSGDNTFTSARASFLHDGVKLRLDHPPKA